jgi:hypothetical protein
VAETETEDLTQIREAIDRNTAVLKDLVRFLVGPKYVDASLGSAEEDKIDDSAGVYATEQQAKDDIMQQWRDDGYPDEVFKYFEQRS